MTRTAKTIQQSNTKTATQSKFDNNTTLYGITTHHIESVKQKMVEIPRQLPMILNSQAHHDQTVTFAQLNPFSTESERAQPQVESYL